MKNNIVFVFLLTLFCGQITAQNYVPIKNDDRMAVQPIIPIQAYSFPLKDIRLLDGPFKSAMAADMKWLMQLNPDRFLYRFHANANLPTKAPIYDGWENTGASGHSFGHYISALSMLYAATGDVDVKNRVDYIINELERCQNARGTGYVGGIPNEDKLWTEISQGNIRALGFELNGLWVPWYTIHKLWAGLLDAYLYTENEKAKTIVIKLTDWACEKFKNLTEAQWQQVLFCEFGGMNDAIYNVYAITGDPKHLQLAEKFYHKSVLDPLAQKNDQLQGQHANTQIPKVVGASRGYELAGNQRDKTIATFFWDAVVHDHSYCIGGNSNYEHFSAPGQLKGQLSPNTAETCNTYNMLKLTRHLFAWDPSAVYMDYYEKALYNHILASQNPETGMVCYSVALASNSVKEFSTPEHSFWCCVGTGFENHVKYAEEIYSQGDDGLYVNLFIASELNWVEKDISIKQETLFPDSDNSQLTITCTNPITSTFHIRYPAWVSTGYYIKINGEVQPIGNTSGSYISINRTWQDGDKIEIGLPKKLHEEALLGDEQKRAFLNGPIVLAGEIEMAKPSPVFLDNGSELTNWIKPVEKNSNIFITEAGFPEDVTLIPFYKKYKGAYSVYFDCFTPEEWEKVKVEYEKEQEYQRELERLTTDYFRPNEQQQEVDHKFVGTNVGRGEAAGRKWCDSSGGYFSFEMKVNPNVPVNLLLTYWGSDSGNRKFDILINEEVVAVEELVGKKPNAFFDAIYPIPFHLTTGKEKVVVKLRAYTNNKAGGIFGARLVLKKVLSEKVVIKDYMLPKEPYLTQHNLKNVPDIRKGVYMGHPWVDTNAGGSLTFDMACSGTNPMSLLLTYWGGEDTKRNFDILIEGEKISTQELYMNKPGEIFDVDHEIPEKLSAGKSKITVTLKPVGNSIAGGLWYALTYEKNDGATSGLDNKLLEGDFPFLINWYDSSIQLKNKRHNLQSGNLSFYNIKGQKVYDAFVLVDQELQLDTRLEKGIYVVCFALDSYSATQIAKVDFR